MTGCVVCSSPDVALAALCRRCLLAVVSGSTLRVGGLIVASHAGSVTITDLVQRRCQRLTADQVRCALLGEDRQPQRVEGVALASVDAASLDAALARFAVRPAPSLPARVRRLQRAILRTGEPLAACTKCGGRSPGGVCVFCGCAALAAAV